MIMSGLETTSPAPCRVLVTGATGYIGAAFACHLAATGCEVVRGARGQVTSSPDENWVCYGDLAEPVGIEMALENCGVVAHFAGHAHVRESAEGVARARQTNVIGSRLLAEAAARAGVRRFVFVSSALVLSGSKAGDGRIDDDSSVAPLTAYARTKAEAEETLRDVSARTGMECVIVRPPMVYGPGSPGNFRRLLRLVDTGLPIPFGSATGAKNFVYIDNLLSAIEKLVFHPGVAGGAYLVSDSGTTSTAALLRIMSCALGRAPRVYPFPVGAFMSLGRLLGRSQDMQRLFEPFYLDSRRLTAATGWRPHVALEEGVAITAAAYRSRAGGKARDARGPV